MENEKVRFISALLTNMVRSVHLPPSRVRDLLEGKVEGFTGVPGVIIDDNFIFSTDMPEIEQKLAALSSFMKLYYTYLIGTYDENIAARRFFLPAKKFLERNKEKVDALDLGRFIPENFEALAARPQVETPKAKGSAGTNMLASGIPGFDRLSGGGVPFSYSILVQAPSGEEAEMFANQFIKQGIEEGASTLAVLSTMSPLDFKGVLAAMGVDPKVLEDGGHLRLIDWYSHNTERISGIEEAGSILKVAKGLTNVGIAINKALRLMSKEGTKRAITRIPASAMTDFQRETTLAFAVSTRSKFKGGGITALFLINKDANDEEVLDAYRRIFDGVIDIKKGGTASKPEFTIAVLAGGGKPGGSQYLPLGMDDKGTLVVGNPGSILLPPVRPKLKALPRLKVEEAPVLKPVEKLPSVKPVKVVSKETVGLKPKKVLAKSGTGEPQASDILNKLRSTKRPEPVKMPSDEAVPTKIEPDAVVPYDDDRISSLASEATKYMKEGRKKDARSGYDKILKIDPKEKDTLMKKAVLLQLEGKHAEAVEYYDRALKVDPDDSEAWSNKGISLRALGKVEDAVKSYDKALKLSPRDAGVWSNRGIALRSLGKNKEAIKSYDRALELNPEDASVWSNRGVLLTTMKQYKDALYSFDQAIKVNPNYEKAKKNRAILLEKMGQE